MEFLDGVSNSREGVHRRFSLGRGDLVRALDKSLVLAYPRHNPDRTNEIILVSVLLEQKKVRIELKGKWERGKKGRTSLKIPFSFLD